MQTIYLPIANPADLSSLASASACKSLETTLYMSRDLVIRRTYPAVDALLSVSRALKPTVVGQEHCDVAQKVRRAIRCAREVDDALARGAEVRDEDQVLAAQGHRLQSFFAQDLNIAEPYTRRPGQFIPLHDTVAACRALLAG